MLFNTVGSLTYQGCLWLTTVLVVVLSSGYYDSGVLAYAMTIGNMFNPIATYCMRPYQVSDTQGEYSQNNYVGYRLITTLLAFLIIIPYTFVVASDAATKFTVCLFLLLKMDEGFVDVMYGVDQRGERLDYVGISQFVRGILLLAGFSAALAVTSSLDIAVIAMFVPCVLVTFIYDIPHARRFGKIRPKIQLVQVRNLLISCLPLVIATLCISMVVSVARQYYGNSFGTESLGIYAAVATPAVLIQAAAMYLCNPALVPLSIRWAESPTSEFPRFLAKAAGILLAGCVAMVVVLSLLGSPFLKLVYGQSIADYTWLFPWVLVSTAIIAMMQFLSDVLTICRNLKGKLISSLCAIGTDVALMIPLEQTFQMNGINLTIIIAMLVGVSAEITFLKSSVRKAEKKNQTGPVQSHQAGSQD